MKTTELERCINLLGYWFSSDEQVINELLDPKKNILKLYVQPFRKELNSNVLDQNSRESKIDVIKHYIFEFSEFLFFFNDYEEILLTGSRWGSFSENTHVNIQGQSRKLSTIENYVVGCNDIFEILFNEIQICCHKFNVDFLETCKELNFSTKYVDIGITLSFVKSDQLTSQENIQTENEIPIFTNNFDKVKPLHIYKHFKASLVAKGYLTEQELHEYLKAAFERQTIPETLFKLKDAPNKAAIEAAFYNYYKNVASKPHGKQKHYAALLGDYFEGYKTTTVSSNFSKSVY